MKIDLNGVSSYNTSNAQNNNNIEKIKTMPSTVQVKNVETKDVKEIKSEHSNYSDLSHKPPQQLSMDEQNWIKLIEKANKAIVGANKTFEYSIHEKTKQIMVKVIDSDTKELIREIPPEKILDLVAKMWEAAGIIVDERR